MFCKKKVFLRSYLTPIHKRGRKSTPTSGVPQYNQKKGNFCLQQMGLFAFSDDYPSKLSLLPNPGQIRPLVVTYHYLGTVAGASLKGQPFFTTNKHVKKELGGERKSKISIQNYKRDKLFVSSCTVSICLVCNYRRHGRGGRVLSLCW